MQRRNAKASPCMRKTSTVFESMFGESASKQSGFSPRCTHDRLLPLAQGIAWDLRKETARSSVALLPNGDGEIWQGLKRDMFSKKTH